MNSLVCVDASFALKLVLDEEYSELVEAIWNAWIERNVEILAPAHLAFEATSVIRNHVYRGEITPETGRQAFDSLHAQPITLVEAAQLNWRAWELAEHRSVPNCVGGNSSLFNTGGCSVYSCLYARHIVGKSSTPNSQTDFAAESRYRARLQSLFVSIHVCHNRPLLGWSHLQMHKQ